MVTLVLGSMTITMKYVVDNNGTPYYQRSIPKDLRERLGKSLFRIKLDPAKGSIASQAQRLADEHSAFFKAMHQDPTLTVSEQKIAALGILAQFGLKPEEGKKTLSWPAISTDAPDDQPHLHEMQDYLIEKERNGGLNATEKLALKSLSSPLPILLSEALEIYFNNHQRGNDPDFRKKSKAHWNKLIKLTGDIALLSLDRDQAKEFMNKRLEAGLKTDTVKREMNQIAAVIQTAIIEQRLNMRNPFERLKPQGHKLDAKKKLVLSKGELQETLDAARAINDDIRRIVAIQIATGLRMAEVVGLRKSDVTLKPLASLAIRQHFDSLGSRTLKTANSERTLPLVPFAAKAAKEQLEDAGDSPYLFPRYNNGKVNNDGADAAVNKWLKKTTGKQVTSHCFRHTIKTLLRGVTSKSISDQITGHSSGDIADDYGLGHSLEEQLKALTLALKGIK